MVRAWSAVAIAIATLLVCCNADLHQDQDVRVGEHHTGDYDTNDFRQKEELENFIRFFTQYENEMGDGILGRIGGSSLLGRNLNNYESSLGKTNGRLGWPTLTGRRLGSGTNNFNRIGGSTLLGREVDYKMPIARFLDPLGGGNFVRNLDPIGGGNFVRNLDSIGGSNFVKKNLDQIGGPNLVKRTLDSIGGGNFVRNLDSIGGNNFVRHVDPLGGGNFV